MPDKNLILMGGNCKEGQNWKILEKGKRKRWQNGWWVLCLRCRAGPEQAGKEAWFVMEETTERERERERERNSKGNAKYEMNRNGVYGFG